jgi:hypothetical protein
LPHEATANPKTIANNNTFICLEFLSSTISTYKSIRLGYALAKFYAKEKLIVSG